MPGSSVNSVNTLVRTKSCCSTISCRTPTTVLSNVIFVNILHQKKNSWSPTWPSSTQVSLGESPPSYVLIWPVDSCPGCLCCLQGRSRSPALCVTLWPSTGRIYASTCSVVTLRPLRSGLWPTPRSLPDGGADLSSPCSRLRSSNNNMTAVQGYHAPLWACDTFLIVHHYPILDLFVAFFYILWIFLCSYIRSQWILPHCKPCKVWKVPQCPRTPWETPPSSMNKVGITVLESEVEITVILLLFDMYANFIHMLLSWNWSISPKCPSPAAEHEQCSGAGWKRFTGWCFDSHPHHPHRYSQVE